MSNLEYDTDESEIEKEVIKIKNERKQAKQQQEQPPQAIQQQQQQTINETYNIKDPKMKLRYEKMALREKLAHEREILKDEKLLQKRIETEVQEKVKLELLRKDEIKMERKARPKTEAQMKNVETMREALKNKREQDMIIKEKIKLEYDEVAKKIKAKLDKKKCNKEIKKKIKALVDEELSTDDEEPIIIKKEKPQPQPQPQKIFRNPFV